MGLSKHTERSADTRGEFLVARFSGAHFSSLVSFFFRPPFPAPRLRVDLAFAFGFVVGSAFVFGFGCSGLAFAFGCCCSEISFGRARLRVERRSSVLGVMDSSISLLLLERFVPRLGGMLF